jgi:histone acetyltransferase (RNA polymerase elongator complex component)
MQRQVNQFAESYERMHQLNEICEQINKIRYLMQRQVNQFAESYERMHQLNEICEQLNKICYLINNL